MSFEIGQTVVYPHHGAATIEEITTRSIRGAEKTYLKLRVNQGDLTIEVPADNVDLVGVRDIVDEDGLEEVLSVLRAPYVEEPTNWSRRFKANQEKIATGDIVKVAEVVRDLTRRDDLKKLSTGEKRMLTKARGILTSELALARGIDKADAAAPFGLRVIIRPRGGSFVYDADEGRAMIADVRRIASLALEMAEFTRPQATGGGRGQLPPAVDLGFVVGALTEDGTIDRGLVRLLVDMANGAPVTFHRAFDQCRDTVEAYGDLEGLGVRYVLTSGAAQTAADGASVIAGLVASGGPIVVAAGAVRPDGLVDLVESTGVREVHMRCPREGLTPDEPQRTDEALVRRAVEAVRTVPLPE